MSEKRPPTDKLPGWIQAGPPEIRSGPPDLPGWIKGEPLGQPDPKTADTPAWAKREISQSDQLPSLTGGSPTGSASSPPASAKPGKPSPVRSLRERLNQNEPLVSPSPSMSVEDSAGNVPNNVPENDPSATLPIPPSELAARIPTPPSPASAQPPSAEPPRSMLRGLKQRIANPSESSSSPASPPVPPSSVPASTPPPVVPPAADLSNMSYEEWERTQADPEGNAQRAAEDELMNAVPDWLGDPLDTAGSGTDKPGLPSESDQDQPPNTPNQTTPGAEFVPDWFAGLDEQPQDAAPDWFKPDEAAATPLTGAPNQPSQAEKPDSEAALPLPDWMTGAVSGGGLDLDSLFTNPDPGSEADFDAILSAEPSSPIIDNPADADSGSAMDEVALDWLSDLPDMPDFSTTESAPPAQESSAPASGSAASRSIPPQPEAEPDLPDWMRDLTPAETGSPYSASEWPESDSLASDDSDSQAAESASLPDWLSGLSTMPTSGTSGMSGTSGESQPEGAQADDLALTIGDELSSADLDKLLSLPMPPRAEAPEPESSLAMAFPPESPSTQLPIAADSIDLDESDLDRILGPMSEAPGTPSLAARTEGRIRTPYSEGDSAPEPIAPFVESEPEPAIAQGELPEFMADMRPSDAPVSLAVGPVQVAVTEEPLAQLSDQLRRLRERGRTLAAPEATARSTTGPLAEIEGTLAVEPSVIQSAANATSQAIPMTTVGDAQMRRVDTLRRMLEIDEATSADQAKARAKARLGGRIKVDRLVITLILFAALIAPFFTNVLNVVAPPDESAPTIAQAAVFKAIDSIGKGQPVLVAFEYRPTGTGELDDLARDFLHDLFARGAKPVIVSTDVAGAMHAESLLSTFGHDPAELKALNRTANQPLLARTDYVVLRYLPAGAAGVRAVLSGIYRGGFDAQTEFTLDLEGQPSGLNLISDLTAIRSSPAIVLAESPEDVRNWAEQYRAPADLPGATPTRIVLGVSAAAAAAAQTYSGALPNVIIGPLVGLRDAVPYHLLRQPVAPGASGTVSSASKTTSLLEQRWQSVGLGALVAAVLILLGALFSALGMLFSRRARR